MLPSPWLVRPVERPHARLTLFCFPCAGGGPVMYRPWGARIADDIEMRAICLPGREVRRAEAPALRLAPVAVAVADAIVGAGGRPFAFFGHSMGALLAYETTLVLRARGQTLPRQLILAGRGAPAVVPATARHRFSRAEMLAHLRDLGGTPDAILRETQLMDLMLPIVRADLEMLETHAHDPAAPPLDLPIAAYHGTRDAYATRELVAAWAAHSTREVAVRAFDGNHFFVTSRTVEVLAALDRELERP